MSSVSEAIAAYKKRFDIEEAMQRGLGEAVPSCGGYPHEQLPWFPPETKP